MLLTREEMAFDFGGARFDPVRDRQVLAWAMNQFLYGEVTGIQVGHWIYQAPDLEAARFLSRQALEEFQHVGNFLHILQLLGERPTGPHPAVRFLATGAMPDAWEEHVALEMAIGEGLVLQCFYAMIDTIDHPEIVAILKRGVKQEERHVDFGEERTMRALSETPSIRTRLLGQALVTAIAVGRIERTMRSHFPSDHAVLRQLPAFTLHALAMMELRLVRMGLTDRPLSQLSALEKAGTIAGSFAEKAVRGAAKRLLGPLGVGRPRRLTDTYLKDPEVVAVNTGSRVPSKADEPTRELH